MRCQVWQLKAHFTLAMPNGGATLVDMRNGAPVFGRRAALRAALASGLRGPWALGASGDVVPASLSRFVRQLAAASHLAFDIELLSDDGAVVTGRARFELSRPNRARIRVVDPGPGASLVCDGKRLRQWDEAVLHDAAAPTTLAGVVPLLEALGQTFWPGFVHLLPDMLARMLRPDDQGADEVDGRGARRVSGFAYDGAAPGRVTVWFDDKTGWPLRLLYTGPGTGGAATTWRFRGYDLQALPPDTFAFAPPQALRPAAADPDVPRIAVGAKAPPFTLAALDGTKFSLRGKPGTTGQTVLLEFWAPWCAGCRAGGPLIKRIHEEFRPRGVALVQVSTTAAKAEVDHYLRSHPPSGTVLYDPAPLETAIGPSLYGVSILPSFVLIDRQGRVAAKWDDYREGASDVRIRAELERSLGGYATR